MNLRRTNQAAPRVKENPTAPETSFLSIFGTALEDTVIAYASSSHVFVPVSIKSILHFERVTIALLNILVPEFRQIGFCELDGRQVSRGARRVQTSCG